jgi:hypothetical protein
MGPTRNTLSLMQQKDQSRHLKPFYCYAMYSPLRFSLNLWDQIMPQAILTLNHIQGSHINPNLSVWSQVFGLADINQTPIEPPAQHLLVQEKPSTRKSHPMPWTPGILDMTHFSLQWHMHYQLSTGTSVKLLNTNSY